MMKTILTMALLASVLGGASSPQPDDVRYHNPLQWRIRKAVDAVTTPGGIHPPNETEAVWQAVLSVLKGKPLESLLDAETTNHGFHQPFPYIRKTGQILISNGDVDYDVTPVVEGGVIVNATITATPVCWEIDVR